MDKTSARRIIDALLEGDGLNFAAERLGAGGLAKDLDVVL
jgi:hypothetical protein